MASFGRCSRCGRLVLVTALISDRRGEKPRRIPVQCTVCKPGRKFDHEHRVVTRGQ